MNSHKIQEGESLGSYIGRRFENIQQQMEGTISSMLHLKLLEYDEKKGEYLVKASTAPWMVNFLGTLHGGLSAAILDQAMGHVAYCLKYGEELSPTINLNINYHRPMFVGDDILIHVKLLSLTKTLATLSAEAYAASAPDRLCVSGTATYYYKPAKQTT